MRRKPDVGESVRVKGYKSLVFLVVEVDRFAALVKCIRVRHPITNELTWRSRAELAEVAVR